MKKTILSLSVAAVVGGSVMLSPLVAASSLLLEEVVVTATRKEEALNSVPVSVTAVTSEQIEAFGLEDVRDLPLMTPNLSIKQDSASTASPILSIRGLLQRAGDATLDTAVGVYVDEVFLGRGYGVIGQMLDTARVEVLRGPQGTLFGRNTIGGAIQLISNAPDVGAGEVTGEVGMNLGSYDLFEYKGVIDIPLGDTVAVRGALSSSEHDGWSTAYLVDHGYVDGVSPILDEIETNDRDNLAWRVSLGWEPSVSTRVDLSAYHSENKSNGDLSRGLSGDLTLPFPLHPSGEPGVIASESLIESSIYASDFYKGLNNVRPSSEYESDIYIAKLVHAFNDSVSMKLILSRAEAELSGAQDTDGWVTMAAPNPGIPGPVTLGISTFESFSFQENETEQNTVELQFSGSGSSYDWIAGLYYFEEEALDQTANGILLHPALFGMPTNPLAFDDTAYGNVIAENESSSVYGSFSYNLTENLLMRLGGRYTEDSKGYLGKTTIGAGGDPELGACSYAPTITSPCVFEPDDAEYENFTWDISLDYQMSDSTFVYGKLGTGYRTGGISMGARSLDSATPFDEDKVTSYELGLKTDLGEAVHVNTTIFYIDWEDVQQVALSTAAFEFGCLQEDPGTAPFVVTCNFSDATSQGVELDAVWQISDALGLQLTAGYTDLDFDDETFVMAFTPEWNYSVTAVWDAHIADMPLLTTLSYSAAGDWFSEGAETEGSTIAEIESPDLVTLWSALEVTDQLTVSIWGRNLLNEEYYANASTAALPPVGIMKRGNPGAPRTYGVDIKYMF